MLAVGHGLAWDGGAALGVEGYGVGLDIPFTVEGEAAGYRGGEVVGVIPVLVGAPICQHFTIVRIGICWACGDLPVGYRLGEGGG